MAYRILDNCKGCRACVKLCPVGAISGASKEVHVIDARLCIDCGACGRICPHEAVQTANGTLAVEVRRSRWPVPVWDFDLCTDCKICVKACPTGAISLNGAHPLLKHRKLCIGCSLCALSCPIGAVQMQP